MGSLSNVPESLLAAAKSNGQVVHTVPADGFHDLIRSIAKKQEACQPFYLLDLAAVKRLMNLWNESIPAVKPYYAVKCNPQPALLAALDAMGANFDCASMPEIETMLSLCVSPDRILYANPCKSESQIEYAARVGVNLTTYDSIGEVDKMKQWHPECDLLLRIKIENDHTSWRQLGTKFGAWPEEIEPLLRHARDSGLRVTGVSFHVGSQAAYAEIYRDAIAAVKRVFEVAESLGMPPMYIMNIGGGFQDNTLFKEIGKTINESIQEFFPETQLTLMAEPGRFFTETTFTLVTNVFGKRARGERRQYWIDDGIYGSFNLPVYNRASMKFKHLILDPSTAKEKESLVSPSIIFGPTCDSTDIVVAETELPELQLHDLIVFYNMGAYTTSAGTNFNGFKTSEIPLHLVYATIG